MKIRNMTFNLRSISVSCRELILGNIIFKSMTILIIFFVSVPLMLIIGNRIISHDMVTGMVTSSRLEIDAKPIVTINDSEYMTGETINMSDCGYDPRGIEVVCTFSEPLDLNEGTWTPDDSEAGVYNVQINATNEWDEVTTKNVSIMITAESISGRCEINFDILDNHRIILNWNETLKINELDYHNYSNFTISYVDYLNNASFNDGDAINVSNIDENTYFDNTANETTERYYKLYAFHDGRKFECNQTYGKYTRNLTMDYGRWNYLSSPFIREDDSFFDFVDETKDDLENAYRYDHDTGSFDFHFFELDFGNIETIDTNECLLIQPLKKTRITTAGLTLTNISSALTDSFGRWNYMGWVAENSEMRKAFDDHKDEIEFLYNYDHDTGNFDFFFFDIDFGNIDKIKPSTCNLIQPYSPTDYEYEINGK